MKNRDNIYLVVRRAEGGEVQTVCSAHSSVEDADREAHRHNQKWLDKGWNDYAYFEVWETTYYDE